MTYETLQPYEAKKSVWVPCPKTGGYREGFLESGGDIANIGAEGADLATKLVVVSEQKFSPISAWMNKNEIELSILNSCLHVNCHLEHIFVRKQKLLQTNLYPEFYSSTHLCVHKISSKNSFL